MKNKNRNLVLAIAFLFVATGFLVPFWPLSVVGIVGAALLGHFVFALIVGAILDLAYGSPTGLLHYTFFPFTLLAGMSSVLYIAGKKFLVGKAPPEHV